MIATAPLEPPPSAAAELGALLEHARAYAAAACAPSTRRAYASQWRGFVAWCGAVGLHPLPATADTLAARPRPLEAGWTAVIKPVPGHSYRAVGFFCGDALEH